MTPQEHYEMAESLLAEADDDVEINQDDRAEQKVRAAQVHATLSLYRGDERPAVTVYSSGGQQPQYPVPGTMLLSTASAPAPVRPDFGVPALQGGNG